MLNGSMSCRKAENIQQACNKPGVITSLGNPHSHHLHAGLPVRTTACWLHAKGALHLAGPGMHIWLQDADSGLRHAV